MPPGRKSRPGSASGAAHLSKINAGSEIPPMLLDAETAARYCAGAFCVVVETPSGHLRRRVFLTLKAAEHAVDLTEKRGQQAVVLLAELRPLYAVEAGQLQPILPAVVA